MKPLLKNILGAPASTAAGALLAVGTYLASDAAGLPTGFQIAATCFVVFVGAFFPGDQTP